MHPVPDQTELLQQASLTWLHQRTCEDYRQLPDLIPFVDLAVSCANLASPRL